MYRKGKKICCKLCQSCYACTRSMSLVTDVTHGAIKTKRYMAVALFNPSHVCHGFLPYCNRNSPHLFLTNLGSQLHIISLRICDDTIMGAS